MKAKFTTGAVVRALRGGGIYRLVKCPKENLMAPWSGFRQPGLECYCGEEFYCAKEPDIPGKILIFQEDDIELSEGLQDGPYYVTEGGDVFSYEIHSPTEVILSNGTVIDDSPTCDAYFVTLESAVAMSKALHESNSWEEAKQKHRKWVEEFTGVKYVPPTASNLKRARNVQG